ncbi:MAG: redox-sensing transcriptional repressor Rex [Pirellulales bacterium]|nr:redox-sensing transcriptional repressor Rex [Pirellulales bacterium]|tara:strand:- start:1332 stop:2003 length:672 start_codon:yes stop_codon:yes gene_type:complete
MSDSKSKLFNDQGELVVPKPVVGRLSLYLREVQHLIRDGRETTNSNELGRLLGVTDAQVRKDLAYFGQFGHPGVGYRCQELVAAIKIIMGTNTSWNVALIGIGNLGRALLRYKGFHEQGFQIVAAFDVDDGVIGTKVEGVDVYHIQHLAKIVMQQSIRLVTIAVPSHAAQTVVDQIVEIGIEGILNFAPVTISVPSQVRVIGVDLAMELEQLAFTVVNRDSNS